AAGDREERTLREFLIAAVQPAALPQSPPETPPAAPRPSLRQARPPAFQPLPLPTARTEENRSMSSSVTPDPRKLSLRALMNMIEKNAGGREAGQLDVYRVFVRVDTQLLKRNGIETLRFTEDRFVSDPELEQAIVRSVKKTLGLDCPQSVWV